MAKSTNGGGKKPPKKQKNKPASLRDIWTGPFKESPAYKKVMADKKVRDSVAASYKAKADAVKRKKQ